MFNLIVAKLNYQSAVSPDTAALTAHMLVCAHLQGKQMHLNCTNAINESKGWIVKLE